MTETYRRADASAEDRAADLLGRMSLDEKIAQLHAFWLLLDPEGNHEVRADGFTGTTDRETLNRMLAHGLGQITRPLGSRAVDPVDGVRALNRLQKFLVEETRLGVPVMSHEECLSGLMARGATLFPSATAYGATWNPDLIEAVGRAIGAECRSVGCHQGLAPVLDVARDARWGRTEETFGEDPWHTGIMASAYIRGLQGEDRRLLATLKHYAGHSLSEGARNHAPVNLGWRELNDTFLLPFEMAVKGANAGSVMPAYHDIDGEPVHASRHLLTQVLREEWGFDGIVVADYIGVSLLYRHHGTASDAAEAMAQAVKAGLDVELPGEDCAAHLKSALDRGLIDMDTIDAAVTRVLVEKVRVGVFEQPYADEGKVALRTKGAVDTALEVARQSITVVSNDGILPLDPGRRIALIGPCADDPLALLGDYSFPVHLIMSDETDDTDAVTTPRAALDRVCADLTYARGCNILDERKAGAPVFPGDVADNAEAKVTSNLSTRTDMIDAAVAVARDAEVAVVCVGDLSGIFQTGTVGEGSDTDSLDLPGVQPQLLEALAATGTPLVVVQMSGRPYVLNVEPAAEIVAWFPGQEGGTALAEILTGAIEPSGRLTLSMPKSAGAAPYFYNHKFKSAGTPIARHFGARHAFGHGLSYTDFAWEEFALEAAEVPVEGGEIVARMTIRNTGGRAGIAVPQLYVRDRLASVVRPVRELKGFARVELQPGEAKVVRFAVPSDMISFTAMDGARRVEPGEVEVMIGASSSDIRGRGTVTLTGGMRPLPKDWRMESRAEVNAA